MNSFPSAGWPVDQMASRVVFYANTPYSLCSFNTLQLYPYSHNSIIAVCEMFSSVRDVNRFWCRIVKNVRGLNISSPVAHCELLCTFACQMALWNLKKNTSSIVALINSKLNKALTYVHHARWHATGNERLRALWVFEKDKLLSPQREQGEELGEWQVFSPPQLSPFHFPQETAQPHY